MSALSRRLITQPKVHAIADHGIEMQRPTATPRLRPLATLTRVIGISLVLAALGLWIVPGSTLAAEMMLIKLGMSIFFVIGGALLVHASTAIGRTVAA